MNRLTRYDGYPGDMGPTDLDPVRATTMYTDDLDERPDVEAEVDYQNDRQRLMNHVAKRSQAAVRVLERMERRTVEELICAHCRGMERLLDAALGHGSHGAADVRIDEAGEADGIDQL